MKPFDLVFIGCFLFTVGYSLWIASLVIRRQGSAALRHLKRICLFIGGYMAIVVVVGALSPGPGLTAQDVLRYDDWCIGVEKAALVNQIDALPAPTGKQFLIVTLKVISEAGRVRQAAPKGSLVQVLDAGNVRHDISVAGQAAYEKTNGSQLDLTTKLDPHTSFLTVRVFEVPENAKEFALAHRHGSGFPGQLIIGVGFRKPPVIPLHLASARTG